jgi:hypothetical protein
MLCRMVEGWLISMGYEQHNVQTTRLVKHWSSVPVGALLGSKSVKCLTRPAQLSDLTFILKRIEGVNAAHTLKNHEITIVPTCAGSSRGPEQPAQASL